MGTLVDISTEDTLKEDLEENLEAELQGEANDNVVTEVEEPEELPDKYKDKSIQDLVQMHQEAEKAIGKQGSEVGELRKIVDGYIQNQVIDKAPEPPKVKEKVDWFSDPDLALDAKLKEHPTIKAMEESNKQSAREASKARMEQEHPDYKNILQDNAFAKWIQESKIRTKLFIEADRGFDADSANELFSLWKERTALAGATADADKKSRKQELKEAATGGARGSNLPSGKKKYRRADIINLMNKDPDRYQQLADEILLAYKEKRVV